MKKKEVKVCEKTFTEMWLAGTPTRIIAETLKISADKCDVTRRRLGLPRRQSWHNSKAGHRKAYLPSEEEIRRKCLEFQAGWSDEERAKRWVGPNPAAKPVEIQIISEWSLKNAEFSEEGMSLEDLADSSGE